MRPFPPHSLEGEQKVAKLERGFEAWLVEGKRLNREQVFTFICTELMDGDGLSRLDPPDLVDLCGRPGMPKLSQVAAWCRINPEWKGALAEAEKVAAMRRVNEAKRIARDAAGAPQAGGSKLAVETLLWEAEKLDRRYSQKQIISDEREELSHQSEAALLETFMAAVMAQPELIKALAPQIKEVLPPALAEQIEEMARKQREREAITVEALP